MAGGLDVLLWGTSVLQLAGVTAAVSTRLAHGPVCRRVCRILFLCLMCAVGGGTVASIACGCSQWMNGGAALCGMVLAATWDRPITVHGVQWHG